MLRALRSKKGFTLVELMIVVAIIGILAAIAIPNFLNFRMKAKTSEAKSNLGAVRSTEVAHYAEYDIYIGNQDYTPGRAADHAIKVAWAPGTRFSIIGFAPEGAVYYDYRLEPIGTDTSSDFTGRARGDLDNDNSYSYYYISDSTTEINHSGAPF